MKKEEMQMRNTRRQKSGKNNKKKVIITSLVGLALVAGGSYVYFQSHFLPTTKVNGVSVGWLNVNAAEEKLAQVNQTEEVVVQTGTKEEKIQLPKKYQLDQKFLKDHLHSSKVKLPLNEAFKKELEAKLATLSFPEGKPSKNASIRRGNGTFEIVPEEKGTVVDTQRLNQQIIADVEAGKGNYQYNAKDFYKAPEITKEDQTLKATLTTLNNKLNKTITVDINGEKVAFDKTQIQNVLNDDGTINKEKLTTWVTQLETTYGSANQPVLFTDVHGTTRRFKNNGSYGWSIDGAKTQELLVNALNSQEQMNAVTAPLVGDTKENIKIANNYIEIDLKDQKMYCFIDGKKIVTTDVITGRYNKGTATVPGFHTILYRTTDVNLEGQMLDGSRYSVPVKYWMPLLSQGGVVTQIGIHDSDHKLDKYGDKEAFKTDAGSNGCINTPGTEVSKIFDVSYDGMPVIIYGHIYDDAPGEFDKPVDYGEEV